MEERQNLTRLLISVQLFMLQLRFYCELLTSCCGAIFIRNKSRWQTVIQLEHQVLRAKFRIMRPGVGYWLLKGQLPYGCCSKGQETGSGAKTLRRFICISERDFLFLQLDALFPMPRVSKLYLSCYYD